MPTARLIWLLTTPLFAGVVFASINGFYSPDFYKQETLNWEVQCTGQDILDLFLVSPVLLISAFFAARNVKIAFLVWAGTNLYLAYTFLIFCFSVHFNSMFLVYCLNLGLAAYSLLFFFYHLSREQFDFILRKLLFRTTAMYFLIIAIMFLGLWLSGIIPAILNNTVPIEIQDIGIATNPVHVIDLSMLLPAIFVTGILLWKNSPAGVMLAPVFLAFLVLMNITIALLNFMMGQVLLATNPAITWVMIGLAIFSLILGYQFISVFGKRNISYANKIS